MYILSNFPIFDNLLKIKLHGLNVLKLPGWKIVNDDYFFMFIVLMFNKMWPAVILCSLSVFECGQASSPHRQQVWLTY